MNLDRAFLALVLFVGAVALGLWIMWGIGLIFTR